MDHSLNAYKIDREDEARCLRLAKRFALPARPIHMSLDKESQPCSRGFSDSPSSLKVYRINKDFSPGEEVSQGAMDAGIYAHQILTTPDGKHVVMVTRGNEGTPKKPEDPGALMVFDYKNGVLVQPVQNCAQRRQGIWSSPLGFPSDKTVDVCVDRNAKSDAYAPNAGRQAAAGGGVQQNHAAGA